MLTELAAEINFRNYCRLI